MKRWLSLCAGISLLAAGCDNGTQTLGWQAAGVAGPAPLPWFGGPGYYARWPNGFPAQPSFFPIGVWMQNPINAARFQAVGVNHYVGLWQGPTDEQLATATSAGMPAVCEQAGVWQENLASSTIQGWLHSDGPDNAQENPDGSYGPCIGPSVTRARYAEMVTGDATRPVMLLLGQGVAIPDWVGRGSCTGQTEDYPLYAEGADILANYTYPLHNGHPIELIAGGLDRLHAYANFEKPVLADLQASNIDGAVRPTPEQLRAQVWMSLIHGAAGILYFCHQMTPEAEFNETDCLDDPTTAAALTAINQELLALAPALNSQSYALSPISSNAGVPVHAVFKRPGSDLYVFAAAMADGATSATFSLAGIGQPRSIEVIGEGRSLVPNSGTFSDAFDPYAVHLYRFALE